MVSWRKNVPLCLVATATLLAGCSLITNVDYKDDGSGGNAADEEGASAEAGSGTAANAGSGQ